MQRNFFYDFHRNVSKRVVSWVSDSEKIKNNVIDCNITLLGLIIKNLPAKQKNNCLSNVG